jgi:hypothetical protein
MATIRIKRRASGSGAGAPSSLANAELCYNEQTNILYYGTGTGGAGGTATSIISIGGSGAFASTSYVDSAISSGVASAVSTQLANYALLSGASFSGNVTVGGNLVVNGTTTTISSTTLSVADKNIELAKGSTTDAAADGGGITLHGTGDYTLNWVSSTSSWTSSENFNLLTGKAYKINGTNVLTATALGSAVVSSSLTSVGTIGTGVWQGTTVAVGYGGLGLTSAITGLLKGNGSAYSAAVVDTDYLSPSSSIDGGTF